MDLEITKLTAARTTAGHTLYDVICVPAVQLYPACTYNVLLIFQRRRTFRYTDQ